MAVPVKLSVRGKVPDAALVPVQAPDAVQLVAFELDHVNVALPPGVIWMGLTDIVTAGGERTVSVALAAVVTPAEFGQVSV